MFILTFYQNRCFKSEAIYLFKLENLAVKKPVFQFFLVGKKNKVNGYHVLLLNTSPVIKKGEKITLIQPEKEKTLEKPY